MAKKISETEELAGFEAPTEEVFEEAAPETSEEPAEPLVAIRFVHPSNPSPQEVPGLGMIAHGDIVEVTAEKAKWALSTYPDKFEGGD